MKTLSTILSLIFLPSIFAQTTAIPDANFEQTLITLGYDSGSPDGTILTASIDTITSLDVQNKNIISMVGVEDFSALKHLNCSHNNINSLDLTQNANLNYLNCQNNQLTTLDHTQNTALTSLMCGENLLGSVDLSQNTFLTLFNGSNNQLQSIDLSQNPALTYIYISNNQLTTLDVSNNTNLSSLYCSFNQLSELNLSENTFLETFYSTNNELKCLNILGTSIGLIPSSPFMPIMDITNNADLICVESDFTSNTFTGYIFCDSHTTFNVDCNNACSSITNGVNDFNKLTNINIYPNPTKDNIQIDLGGSNLSITATLCNVLGEVIINENYSTVSQFYMDIEAPKGIYFLIVETNRGESVTQKIIKE